MIQYYLYFVSILALAVSLLTLLVDLRYVMSPALQGKIKKFERNHDTKIATDMARKYYSRPGAYIPKRGWLVMLYMAIGAGVLAWTYNYWGV